MDGDPAQVGTTVLICKLQNRYKFCMGDRGVFDPDDVVRYGAAADR